MDLNFLDYVSDPSGYRKKLHPTSVEKYRDKNDAITFLDPFTETEGGTN